MNERAVGRILHRLCVARGGDAEALGAAPLARWNVAFPEDASQPEGPKLSFTETFAFADGRVTEITCDAPIARLTLEQSAVVAGFQHEVTEAIRREGVVFDAFADAQRFLAEEVGAETDGEITTVWIGEKPEEDADNDPDSELDEPVIVSCIDIGGEPWLSLSTAFADDVDPAWLMEKNGELSHLHFEAFEGSVSLASGAPLATLTGQRLLDLVDDLALTVDLLLEDWLGGDADEAS